MNVYVKYNERKRLKCVFNTLVIKNEAMERLYEGGLIGLKICQLPQDYGCGVMLLKDV